jgi:hypothetical protein
MTTMQRKQWTKGTLTPNLSGVDRGSIVIDCHLLHGTIAVHRSVRWDGTISPFWRVSHAPSGLSLGSPYFKRLRDAKEYAVRIYILEPETWAQDLPNISHLTDDCKELNEEFKYCP